MSEDIRIHLLWFLYVFYSQKSIRNVDNFGKYINSYLYIMFTGSQSCVPGENIQGSYSLPHSIRSGGS